MSEERILRFYLEPSLQASAKAGEHNFIGKVSEVVREAGFTIEYRANTLSEKAKAPTREGFAMFHMEEPTHTRALTFRRVYYYPFWAIEPTGKRWDWEVAKASFAEAWIDRKEAQRFARYWRNRLFGEWGATGRDGYVYIALQGRLKERRSFQACSPIEMIEQVLEHDNTRPVIAALHPKETYDNQELAALEALKARHPRLRICKGDMERLLPRCDYTVTQNSSVGFAGYFLGKPCVLFGQIDFHHIAANVGQMGAENAIRSAPDMGPDYEGYLWWFLQIMAINAGRPEAHEKIKTRLNRAGWPTGE